jgi:hypothetical protein
MPARITPCPDCSDNLRYGGWGLLRCPGCGGLFRKKDGSPVSPREARQHDARVAGLAVVGAVATAALFLGLAGAVLVLSPAANSRPRLEGERTSAPPAVEATGLDAPTAAETSADEIQTFGRDMLGQRRELAGRFSSVHDTWVRLWGLGEGYVGVSILDRRGNLFQFAFADKAQHGRELLAFRKGEPIRLVGTVRQVEERERYVLMVEEVRRR